MHVATITLTPQEMADLGAYYESLRPASSAIPPASKFNDSGVSIHIQGAAGVPPCAQCHGVDAKAEGNAAPPLAGQEPTYIVGQLRAFSDGSRKALDSDGAMKEIAARLNEDDRAAVAEFYAGLPPRGAQ